MSESLISSVVKVATAIIGLAIIAALVSKHAATGDVLNAGGNAFSQLLCQAMSGITGRGCTPSVSSNVKFG